MSLPSLSQISGKLHIMEQVPCLSQHHQLVRGIGGVLGVAVVGEGGRLRC